MGFFSKIIRKVTKPIKKVLKSPLGKAALFAGLGYLAGPSMAKMMGGTGNTFMGRLAGGGWKQALMGNTTGVASGMTGGPFSGILSKAGAFIGKNKLPLAIAGGSGILTAAAAGKQPSVDEAFASNQDTSGHDAYLNTRKYFPFGDTSSQYYTAPLYNEGGRVELQGGGQGLASLGYQQSGDEGQVYDQVGDMSDQGPGAMDQGPSEDQEFIALIQQLAAMGIPLEQLRGRTKQELVEMMIYVSSKMQGRGVQEDVAVEEQVQMASGGDPEYKGWKNMYELNPDAASQHPRHQEFIIQYESEKMREPKTEGGDLFLKESTEILEGRPDGSREFMTEEELEETYPGLARGEVGGPVVEEIDNMREFNIANPDVPAMNEGGIMRTGYAMGTEHPVIPSSDGAQLDMRDTGGYQPHGQKEKHDDVRALLAQGEFVMTSDAVKGLGAGDRDEGAKKMYDMMHKLEAMA